MSAVVMTVSPPARSGSSRRRVGMPVVRLPIGHPPRGLRATVPERAVSQLRHRLRRSRVVDEAQRDQRLLPGLGGQRGRRRARGERVDRADRMQPPRDRANALVPGERICCGQRRQHRRVDGALRCRPQLSPAPRDTSDPRRRTRPPASAECRAIGRTPRRAATAPPRGGPR